MTPLTLSIACASRLLHHRRTGPRAATPTTETHGSSRRVDATPRGGPRPHHAVVRWLEYYGLAEGRAHRA